MEDHDPGCVVISATIAFIAGKLLSLRTMSFLATLFREVFAMVKRVEAERTKSPKKRPPPKRTRKK